MFTCEGKRTEGKAGKISKENMISCSQEAMGQNTDKVVLLKRNENKDILPHGKE